MMMIIIIQLFYLAAVGKQVEGKTSLGTTDDDEIGNDIFRLDFFTLKLNRKICEKIGEKNR